MRDVAIRIEDALRFVPADDRDTWLRMGMAIKAELGDGGHDIWDRWSRQSDKYSERDADTVWRSFSPDGGVTAGTLFHEAQGRGWRWSSADLSAEPTSQPDESPTLTDRSNRTRVGDGETASWAMAIWRSATPAEAHPYLIAKNVEAVDTLRVVNVGVVIEIIGYVPKAGGRPLRGNLLIVPVKVDERLSTLELIDEDGRKTALAGRGTKRGGYWAPQAIPEDNEIEILLAEGVATALTAKQAMGFPCIAALSSSNLPVVARKLRERHPGATITVLADVSKTNGSPDPNAVKAAKDVGGKLASPDFGGDRSPAQTDFNDLAACRGLETVNRCIGAATAQVQPAQGSILYRRAADVRAMPVEWLWPGRIARGKVSLIAGHPGLGKSQVAAYMAGTVTTGGRWAVDEIRCEVGNVVFLSAEDDPADTIRPRLEAVGADLARVTLLESVVAGYSADGQIQRRAFDLGSDVGCLETVLHEIGDVRLVVIDPISAYLGTADSHKNAEVRALLAPVSDLAQRCRVAVVCISHLNKGGPQDAVMRIAGSIGFTAAARAAYLVAKHPDDSGRRLFLPIKNNLGVDDTGLAFTVSPARVGCTDDPIDTSMVVWDGEAVDMSADEAMATNRHEKAMTRTDEAEEFLLERLASGPVEVATVRQEAARMGFTDKPLRVARERLGVITQSFEFQGKKYWRLPTANDALDNNDAHTKIEGTIGPEGNIGNADKPDGVSEVIRTTTDVDNLTQSPSESPGGVGDANEIDS